MSILVVIVGLGSVAILGGLAFAFWSNPDRGLEQTTHRLEKLPLVMADRYAAFAVMGLALTLSGHLPLLAVFFAICAFMGFADGYIYARAGHPHVKHTASGVLSLVALTLVLIAYWL